MRRTLSVAIVLGLAGAALLLAPQRIVAQRAARFERETVNGRDVVAREVLVKFRQPPQAADLAQIRADGDADDVRSIGRAGVFRLRSRSRNVAALLATLRRRPDVAYAEPNFIVRMISEPNDPQYAQLWALKNIGQVFEGLAGVPGADIHAVPAWNISLGSTANVVAVIDTGIDYTHPDLVANMWSAPTAFTVNIDGSPITCAAGTHGFNAITRTCNPMDDQDHGTHVSGTIGATGDNGMGVVGVNWTTRLMAIKFIDATGNGTTEDAIAAVEFAIAVKQRFSGTGEANIRVLSNSWGGPDFSQALLDEVNAANDEDMLFVAGAGNDSFDNDIVPFYPASFDAPNVGLRDRDRQHGRPGVVLELRCLVGSPGSTGRRHPVDDDRQSLRVSERHIDGDAACLGSRGARAVGVCPRYGGAEGNAPRHGRSAAGSCRAHDERWTRSTCTARSPRARPRLKRQPA